MVCKVVSLFFLAVFHNEKEIGYTYLWSIGLPCARSKVQSSESPKEGMIQLSKSVF